MRPVTRQEFFAAIGHLDVMPRVDVASFKHRIHVSNWETQHTRQLVGRSESDSHGSQPTKFYLTEGLTNV